MQNPIQKFRQSSIVCEKPSILPKKFENFDELQLPYSSMFFAETSLTVLAYQCLQKSVRNFFLLFRSWVICKS